MLLVALALQVLQRHSMSDVTGGHAVAMTCQYPQLSTVCVCVRACACVCTRAIVQQKEKINQSILVLVSSYEQKYIDVVITTDRLLKLS